MNLVIRQLTPELEDDFIRFFDEMAYTEHQEWGKECYCCFFHAPSAEVWKQRTSEENRSIAGRMVRSGDMRGYLAYVDGQPAGWCHADAKASMPGIKVFYPDFIDNAGDAPKTCAIVCFTIAQSQRRKGLAGRLLDQVLEDLAGSEFDRAEAYPRWNKANDEENYHGLLSLFESRGFEEVRRLKQHAVMQKALG